MFWTSPVRHQERFTICICRFDMWYYCAYYSTRPAVTAGRVEYGFEAVLAPAVVTKHAAATAAATIKTTTTTMTTTTTIKLIINFIFQCSGSLLKIGCGLERLYTFIYALQST